jgi:hypothetical protein
MFFSFHNNHESLIFRELAKAVNQWRWHFVAMSAVSPHSASKAQSKKEAKLKRLLR